MKSWMILILSLSAVAGCGLMPKSQTCPVPGKIEIYKSDATAGASATCPHDYGMDSDSMSAILLYIRSLEEISGCD